MKVHVKTKLSWTNDGMEAVAGGEPSVRDLVREEMKVAFQPIVDMETGRTFALEVLARCQRDGLTSPMTLFEKAVAQRASGRLGRLIRDVAFAECPDQPLFVNIHPDELSDHWLIRPDDPLGFHGPPVYLEITEGAAFTHFDLCAKVLMELCARTGAHLVVDDFGAGYSNIGRILDLEPAIVKLDLALIRDIHVKPRQRAVVRHVVALCADLGCRVVAEGIESVEELLVLRELGVHFAQGYLLARPAFEPPTVSWPAEMGKPVFGSLTPKRSVEPPSAGQRRSPTLPASPRPSLTHSGRVLIEEVVHISHTQELRPRPSSLKAGAISARKAPSRAPAARASKAPTVRPKSPSSRSAPPSRASRAPKKRTSGG